VMISKDFDTLFKCMRAARKNNLTTRKVRLLLWIIHCNLRIGKPISIRDYQRTCLSTSVVVAL